MESKSIVKNMSNLKLTKEDCNICTEEVLIRKMVKCPFCLFSACIDCTSKFLMNIDDDLPRCMSLTCKKVWTYEFLAEKFDVTFHNKTYRERRADLFLQQQKALLPGTQHLVEQRNSEMKKKMLIKDLEDENYMLKTLIERNKNKIRNITYGIYDEEKKDYVVVWNNGGKRNLATYLAKANLFQGKFAQAKTLFDQVISSGKTTNGKLLYLP